MAHYAFLDENNLVVEVIVGLDEGQDGVDWEQHYGNFRGLKCKRTSYNTRNGVHVNGGTPFRKNYAGIGMIYREDIDAFIPPKPHDSWILNETIGDWESPIGPPPELTESEREPFSYYRWDEETISWALETPEE
jgi:hypothetical protein